MRLYVTDNKEGMNQKIYLNIKARTRAELQGMLGTNIVKVNDKIFKMNEVFAEPEQVALY